MNVLSFCWSLVFTTCTFFNKLYLETVLNFIFSIYFIFTSDQVRLWSPSVNFSKIFTSGSTKPNVSNFSKMIIRVHVPLFNDPTCQTTRRTWLKKNIGVKCKFILKPLHFEIKKKISKIYLIWTYLRIDHLPKKVSWLLTGVIALEWLS